MVGCLNFEFLFSEFFPHIKVYGKYDINSTIIIIIIIIIIIDRYVSIVSGEWAHRVPRDDWLQVGLLPDGEVDPDATRVPLRTARQHLVVSTRDGGGLRQACSIMPR